MNDPQPALKRITQLEGQFTKAVYSPGAHIFEQGERGDAAYIVRKGEVEIYKIQPNEERVLLAVMRPGQIFGELALLNERRRTATATTNLGCELVVIQPSQVTALLDKAPPFLRYWIEHLGNQVIALTKRVD